MVWHLLPGHYCLAWYRMTAYCSLAQQQGVVGQHWLAVLEFQFSVNCPCDILWFAIGWQMLGYEPSTDWMCTFVWFSLLWFVHQFTSMPTWRKLKRMLPINIVVVVGHWQPLVRTTPTTRTMLLTTPLVLSSRPVQQQHQLITSTHQQLELVSYDSNRYWCKSLVCETTMRGGLVKADLECFFGECS